MKALLSVLSIIVFSQSVFAQNSDRLKVQVNSKTLNLFLPIELLTLPCFMPIEIKTSYNSYASDSSLFGNKWTFNYNLRIRADGPKFVLMEGDGFENVYTKERTLEESKRVLVDQIMVEQRKADVKAGGLKSPAAYDELKRKLMSDATHRAELENKLLGKNRTPQPGTYYSFARGPSTLEFKADGSFKRTFQNGAFDLFDKDGKLTKTSDRHGNSLEFSYLGKNLVKINDVCGRSVSLSYKADKAFEGLVDTIKDTLNRELRFEFTNDRNLRQFRTPKSEVIEFTYDKVGNLKTYALTNASKQRQMISLDYNAQYEVQRESTMDQEEKRYKRTFVANNPNHSVSEITRVKNEKIVSREVQEYKAKEFETITRYDAKGEQVGKETRKISPVTGYPSSILDEAGRGDLFEYDQATGNLLKRQSIPQGEIQEYEYDSKCNQIKKLKVTRPGQPVAETEFKFDPKCNLLSADEKQNGKATVSIGITWNSQGKISFLRDLLGKREIAFTYWKYGKPESITLRDVGTLFVKYTVFGDIEKVDTFPHGMGKKRFEGVDKSASNALILNEVKTALDDILGFLRPSGLNIGL